jgi:hypothetical protein
MTDDDDDDARDAPGFGPPRCARDCYDRPDSDPRLMMMMLLLLLMMMMMMDDGDGDGDDDYYDDG